MNTREISQTTIAHYDREAEAFWEGTRDHDVTQNYAALLAHLPGAGPFTLLDFGCGPGRDLRHFVSLGHTAVGLDGSARFVEMARRHSGCEVYHQDFLALDLPPARFDGVFANAALFHVPGQELPAVLGQLSATLKPGGVLFCSNPRGFDREARSAAVDDQEGWSGQRYGCYRDLDGWRRVLAAAGFIEVDHYYRPAGLPRHQQPWLAMVWRKPAP